MRRNGKFGIGLLAAFLIGEEIHVETRKSGEKFGYTFTTALNTSQINISKDPSISQGTSIKIKILDDKFVDFHPDGYIPKSTLQWFKWYTLNTPSIKYYFLDKEIISDEEPDPDLEDDLPLEWHAIDAEGFNKIHWTYEKEVDDHAWLSCNGIIIPSDRQGLGATLEDTMLVLPKTSIFDYEGNLPLTLNRNDLSERLPFEDALVEDIYKDFIAFILSHDDLSRIYDKSIELRNIPIGYPGIRIREDLNNLLFFKKWIYDQRKLLH